MVGPPFDELSCFVAMKLRIRWSVMACSAAPTLATNTARSSESSDTAPMLTVSMLWRGTGTALINRRSVSGTIYRALRRNWGMKKRVHSPHVTMRSAWTMMRS
jgi:hypothetical protein